jgi:hypothetical protein
MIFKINHTMNCVKQIQRSIDEAMFSCLIGKASRVKRLFLDLMSHFLPSSYYNKKHHVSPQVSNF